MKRVILTPMKLFAVLWGIMLLSLTAMASDLQLTLSWFGANPTTNRTITLQSTQPFQGDIIWLTSDTNGMAVYSNAPVGLINGVIRAPPGEIKFQLYLTATNLGLIDASNCTASGTATTYPAGGTAWSISTSDRRYQFSGTTLSNTFYPLYSNPSNYAALTTVSNIVNATTGGYSNSVYHGTNEFDLAGAGAAAALLATNTASIVRTDLLSFDTNWLNTNLMGQISLSNQAAMLAATNLSTAERNAMIATQAWILGALSASNTAAINLATNDAWQQFTNAANSGAYAFNLGASTNLPWTSLTGIGTLNQWKGIGTNDLFSAGTNWTVGYLAGFGYANTNQLASATNTIYTNLAAQLSAVIASATNNVSTNATAMIYGVGASVTNLNTVTSNALATAQKNGTNDLLAYIYGAYVTPDGTNKIWTNSLASFYPISNPSNYSTLSQAADTNKSNLTITTNLFGVATNYANTNSSALVLNQGTASTNNENSLFGISTNYAGTNTLANVGNGTNYTRQVGTVATNAWMTVSNLAGYVAAIQAGNRFNILVSGASSGSNENGTDVWQSATSWTNLNGLSFITNDVSGSRIYASGIPAHGSVGGYPVGSAWTNISGSSPFPVTSFLATPQFSGTSITGQTLVVDLQFTNGTSGQVLTKGPGNTWGWSNSVAVGSTNSLLMTTTTNPAQTYFGAGYAGPPPFLNFYATSIAATNLLMSFDAEHGLAIETGYWSQFYGGPLGLGGTNGVTGTNGITLIQATNIANGVYSNNPSGYITAGGSVSNAISNLNGTGTNTSLGFILTNIFGSPILLVGTNFFVTGTNYYYYDGDTNSWAYTNFPTGNYIAGVWSGNYGPVSAFTNGAGASMTNREITLNYNSVDGSGVGAYDTVTNGGLLAMDINESPFFASAYTPSGKWQSLQGATNAPTGSTVPSQTNYTFWPIIKNGRFNPMVYQLPITYVSNYSVLHGLPQKPSRADWSLLCVFPDAGTGSSIGDEVAIDSIIGNLQGSKTDVAKYITTNSVILAPYYLLGNTAFSVIPEGGGGSSSLSNIVNWVLQVKIYP